MTIAEAGEYFASGELSAEELTKSCLARLRTVEPKLRAFLLVDEERALSDAHASDERRRFGNSRGPLDGIPVALKDNLLTANCPTTAGSKYLKNFVPLEDAEVTKRLRAAGAVVVGKTNLDEFGMGSSTENSAFHPTLNPWDTTRVPGGSSGGSAAAVASGAVMLAFGSDTGGSIRQPAALTGLVGVKPTYGRVSRRGLVAYASSLDTVGPLARTPFDAALALAVIAGHDPRDSTTANVPVPEYAKHLTAEVAGLRIGIPREYFGPGVQSEIASRVREAADALASWGAQLREVSLPSTDHALAAYYLVAASEASSNLARYDGVRYGHRASGDLRWRELSARSRAEGFGDEVKRRVMLGTFALSHGYYDAFYLKAQAARKKVRGEFETLFAGGIDVVLAPTSPVSAWKVGEKIDDPLAMYAMDALTVPVSLAGLPGISVPLPETKDGLPVGLQFIGPHFEEQRLFSLAHALLSRRGVKWRFPKVT